MITTASGQGKDGKERQTAIPKAPVVARGLVQAMHNAGVAAIYQDNNLRVLWAHNLPSSWTSDAAAGKTDADFLPAIQAERMAAAKRAVLESGKPMRLEIRVPQDEGARWFEIWIDPDREGPERPVQGLITTAVDITEHRRREQTLRALLRELSHRSKNLLAIIQSIATQTGRYSGSIETFLSRFRGRLQSLAASQDLVTSSNWRGADLHELVLSQVGRYSADIRHAVVFEGINPYLNPNATLHIGLALHELAVNSANYGALAKPGGFVTVASRLVPDGDGENSLSLAWTEAISADQARNEKRFGSVTLERVVPTSLNGAASFQMDSGRLRYELVIPAESFEIE